MLPNTGQPTLNSMKVEAGMRLIKYDGCNQITVQIELYFTTFLLHADSIPFFPLWLFSFMYVYETVQTK